ncbi:hypothetical protein J3B02_005936, partial [Coemansia erecta]
DAPALGLLVVLLVVLVSAVCRSLDAWVAATRAAWKLDNGVAGGDAALLVVAEATLLAVAAVPVLCCALAVDGDAGGSSVAASKRPALVSVGCARCE